MELIKKFIYEKISTKEISHDLAKQMLNELQDKNSATDEPIAIIGAEGRFANAKNLDEYWSNLRNGLNCIGDFPTERIGDSITHLYNNPNYCEFVEGGPIDEKDFYNKDIFAKGSYLDEIDKFDADFFDIPPREAKYMDPHQRVFLEVAFSAIENAGYNRKKITGSNTGVFLGKENTNISYYKNMSKADALQLTGSWESITVSRLNYFLDLKGPAMMIDAACSSGLISVHMACESIHRGECDMAIAGGICLNILAPQDVHKDGKDLSSVEAKDFLVKTFDKNANGTVWGEGIGVVMLKPLSKAIKDKDNIHAVIKSSVINNDGTSSGIIAPDAASQEALLVKAWEKAKINPETINYIEAHGTGTVLGDPIEFKGLTNAFRRYTKKKQFCGIGSLKTSLGHLVAASGMASLFKVVLALKNQQIPPSINFNYPNPYINFCDSPLFITDTLTHWEKQDEPRRAGVSSFGFSGTNCHVVLEEYIKPYSENNISGNSPMNCLTISAKNEDSVVNFINRYKTYLNKNPYVSMTDMCYSANTGKDHYSHRLAIIFKDRDDLKQKLDVVAAVNGFNPGSLENCYYNAHKIIAKKSGATAEGYIDESQKQQFTEEANNLVNEFATGNDADKLSEICKLYVKGADVDWQKLYSDEERSMISVPLYPFERTRYWTDPKVSKITIQQSGEKIDHQLFDCCLARSINETIFLTEFNVNKHWVLSDHKIMDNCVIPGTTYLEMARAAAASAIDADKLELRDVFFITPLMVNNDETIKVHTIISYKDEGKYSFTIASIQNDGGTQWLKHAEGTIVELENNPENIYDLEEIKNRNKELISYEYDSQESAFGVFTFGQRWANVVSANHGDNEALVELTLPDNISTDLGDCFLHPGMLDNAMNYMSQSSENETYLPFTYKSFKYYQPLQKTTYSYIRKKTNKAANSETISFDVVLLGKDGSILSEINDYVIKKVHNVGSAIKAGSNSSIGYFEMAWKEVDFPGNIDFGSKEPVLIFKGKDKKVLEIIEKLKDKVSLIEVESGTSFEKVTDTKFIIGNSSLDYEKLLFELKDLRFNSIIHSFALSGMDISSAKDLADAENIGVYSLYHLVRAAVSNKIKLEKGITILTDYAYDVDNKEPAINAHNAALIGLAKVIGLEYEQLSCKCVDTDHMTSVDNLINEIGADDNIRLVAFRDNKRFIEILRTVDKNLVEQNPVEIKENGVYLITGGMGGLGLAMAGFLASQSKIRLCLVGRSKIADRSRWDEILTENKDKKEMKKIKEIRELESKGAQVFCYSADVCDEDDLESLISSIRNEHGKIDGIIHCAGVAGNGFVINRGENVFRSVIEPKTMGSYLLDKLTLEFAPDFYALFSTITSLTGDPGQGDYTAAGCYLDSFSAYRNKKGGKTVTINWPIWSETGMAVEYGASDNYTIFKSLTNEKAFEAFKFICGSSKSRIIPGKINFKLLASRKNLISFDFDDEIKRELLKEEKKSNKEETSSGGKKIIDVKVTGKPTEDLNEIEKVLIQIWAQVLDVNKLDVYDDFQTVGGDSILTSELLKAINTEYPDVMDISDIYYYNTIVSMAEYIEGIINSR
ncbi:MAG: SDR family oxidoreductase [Bacillota bacterium]|nr:SDR family oxidoreductase [Bacillota bacterium]